MDILNDYAKMKAAKLIRLEKYGQQFAAVVRQWDAATGQEIGPSFAVFSKEQLQDEVKKAQAKADSIAAILADVDALA